MSEHERTTLAKHFIMWHDLDGPDTPPGEWRCACGMKFGFSDSAIDHQVAMLASRTTETGSQSQQSVQKELADFHPGTGHLHTCAKTRVSSGADCTEDCVNHLYAVAQDLEHLCWDRAGD